MKSYSFSSKSNWSLRDTFFTLIIVIATAITVTVVYTSQSSEKITPQVQCISPLNSRQKALIEQLRKNITIDRLKRNATTSDTKLSAFWAGADEYKIYADKLNSLFSVNKPLDHKTRLLSTHRCEHRHTLVIIAASHPTNYERRETVRKTWGTDPSTNNTRWKTVFLVGRFTTMEYSKELIDEIEKYGDIVLGDVAEEFGQLTHKVLMGMEWALKYCPFDYLFKTDDDVFINMPQLFNFLDHKKTPKTGLYAGNVNYRAVVRRSGRYAVPRDKYKKDLYPSYCSGGGYVLSKDVIQVIIPIFQNVTVLPIEDAYTGILVNKAGVNALHNAHFKMFQTSCDYNKNVILHHPVKRKECMKKLFKQNLVVNIKDI